MKPNQWLTLVNFYTSTLPQKMEMLQARREELFQQQHELLRRRAALTDQIHNLIERQTAHELQSRLFWHRLRRATIAEQKDEA